MRRAILDSRPVPRLSRGHAWLTQVAAFLQASARWYCRVVEPVAKEKKRGPSGGWTTLKEPCVHFHTCFGPGLTLRNEIWQGHVGGNIQDMRFIVRVQTKAKWSLINRVFIYMSIITRVCNAQLRIVWLINEVVRNQNVQPVWKHRTAHIISIKIKYRSRNLAPVLMSYFILWKALLTLGPVVSDLRKKTKQ